MSKSNYRRCVTLGVTGRHTSTCYPAAIDKLLPGQRIDPEYYAYYHKHMSFISDQPDAKQLGLFHNLYTELQQQINADRPLFLRVTTAQELRAVVRSAVRSEMKVVLDIDSTKETVHSLGLHAINARYGHYFLTSNHTPFPLQGVVTLGYVFPFLAQPEEPVHENFMFNNANVTLIPSA